MSQRKALILGATGLIGSHLTRQLLADDAYTKVIAPARRSLGIEDAKLQEISFDFSDWKAVEKTLPVDDVFCCLGTTMKVAGSKEAFRRVDYEYPLELARLASKSGSKRFFLVSSLGADANSAVFYSKTKGEIENAVGELSFEALHIMRPSLLLGNRGEKRLGEEIGMAAAGILGWTLIGPLRRYRAIQAETVARAMRNLALQGAAGAFVHESDAIESAGQ